MTDITDTLEENSASDIVADAKAWLADIGGGQRLQTHSGNCHKWHSTCLVSKLTREIERLRTPATHATPTQGSVRDEGTVGERLVGRLSITQAMLADNERLRAEIARLREAIRRLADQDATLSAQGGNVTVEIDATLTDAEREAVEYYVGTGGPDAVDATLRGLLERLSDGTQPIAIRDCPVPDNAPKPDTTPPQGSVQPEWMSKPFYVDPPSGHRYGFPKLYDPASDGDMTAWMVANGYPQHLADRRLNCTFTATE